MNETAEYLSIGVSWVSKLISKNVLTEVEVINDVRYIRREYVTEYLNSIKPPKGYLSAVQASQELSVSKTTINSLAKKGAFHGAKKQKVSIHRSGWVIPIEWGY
ncbi:hypothetical protein VQL36_03935 [Chengkuizengella sp. SCS-71B]|uniref:hypothetical protein n=1 Tax=Chengkuizengella sp. SCS-71B TaxID=3115290 RepID=UPI0032C2436D